MVEPSAVQRGRPSMPPADSTEGCAAHGPISTARKKRSMGMAQLASFMPTPRGKGRKGDFSPPRDVRFLGRKARSLSTRLGPARPLGTPPGGYCESRSLIQANRRSSARVTLQNPRPRFGKHVLGLRLSATPSDHAFRPRLSHAFQPRFPAMSSDVPFGSRTLCFCHCLTGLRSSKVGKSSGVHATSLCGP